MSFLDLNATVLDLAGAGRIPATDSVSLVPTLADPSSRPREVVFSGLGQWRIAFDGRHKLVARLGSVLGAQGHGERALRSGGAIRVARLVEPAADPCETRDLGGRAARRGGAAAGAAPENATRPRPAVAAVPA